VIPFVNSDVISYCELELVTVDSDTLWLMEINMDDHRLYIEWIS